MNKKLLTYSVAMTSASLISLGAMAQDGGFDISEAPAQSAQAAAPAQSSNNEVTLGAVYVGGSNTGLYGRYNGFTTQGADLVGGFRFRGGDAWDSGESFYYTFEGSGLVIQTGNKLSNNFKDSAFTNGTSNRLGPEAELSLEFGERGSWRAGLGYNAISYAGNIINSIYTVTGTSGTLNGGLAPSGGASNSPLTKGSVTSFNTTTLSPAEQKYQVGTRRDIIQALGEYLFDDWTISAKIRHEHKEGTLEDSLRETYGGQAFTLPIDYDTDRLDIAASYMTEDLQAVLQYTFMNFSDNNTGIKLPFPASISTLSNTSGPYAQVGLYSTPPSSYASYFTGMLGYNFSPDTRLTANTRIGMEIQDSTFPANSANPNLSNTLGNPTYSWFNNLNSLNQGTGSVTSPNAFAWTYHGNLALDSRLAENLDGRVSYAFDGRQVTIDAYQVWIGGPSPDATANTAVYVVPQGWFNQTAKVDLTYRLDPETNTKIGASYAYNAIDRTNAQVEHSTTNIATVELITSPWPEFLGRLAYEHADRSGELIYGTAWGNLEVGEPEIEGTPSGAYYQAPMTSDSIIVRGTYVPMDNKFSSSLFLKYNIVHFTYPDIPVGESNWTLVGHGEGIKSYNSLVVGPDLTYQASPNFKAHLYYTYEHIFYDNRGNGACYNSNTGNCLGSVGYFQNTYTNNTQTAGLSGEWRASDRLTITGDYNLSYGTTLFHEFNGVQVATITQSYQNVTDYPNIDARTHQVQLTADYQVTSRVKWSLIYRYDMFHNNDWNNLTAPVQPSTNTGTAISILTPGYPPPTYNVTTIGTTVKVAL